MKVESIRRMEARKAGSAAAPVLESLSRRAVDLWRQIVRVAQRPPRRLRLCENLALGDRRFVAVVEYENSRFLVGGTSSSLVLLARLGPDPSTDSSSGDGAPTPALSEEVQQ